MSVVSLADTCERIDYGLTASATASGGPKFLRITDIESSHVDWISVPSCAATAAETSKYALASGDVVVARTGASTGRSQWIELIEPAVFASYLVRFRAGPRLVSKYLGYVLSSTEWRHYVSSVAHGKSAQPNMSAAAMAEFRFTLPELEVQQAIAEVLSALDDKIAANSHVVARVEELTCAQFRVLSDEERVPLSSLARFVNGKAFTKDATGTGRIVVRIAELNSGIGGSTVYNDIEVADEHLARPGDLLFAWSGSLTVARWYRPEAIVNQHIFKVIPNDGVPMWLVNQAVRAKLDEFKAIAADKATTMGHIQRRHLDEPVAIPAAEDMRRIDGLMAGLWETALAAEVESLKLTQTRDELLPLLMSGKVRVRDAERVASQAL